jgi:integrase
MRFLRWTGYGPLTADLRRIEDFFGGLPTDTSLEERQGLQSVLRQFLTWRGIPKGKWPGVLNGRMHGPRKHLTRDDLLTFEEVQALVDAGENPRDRAFMAVLYDTGARIEEVTLLKFGDVREHKEYVGTFVVTFRKSDTASKAHTRTNSLFESHPLVQWLNEHPTKDPRDPLWTALKGEPEDGITVDALRWRFTHIVDRAKELHTVGRHRRIHPHLMRHTRATRLIEMGYSETKLKVRLGWTVGTRMLERYIHLAAEADTDEEARVHGVKVIGKKSPQTLKAQLCPRCDAPNPRTYIYCFNCGKQLSEDAGFRALLREAYGKDPTKEDLLEALDRLARGKPLIDSGKKDEQPDASVQ